MSRRSLAVVLAAALLGATVLAAGVADARTLPAPGTPTQVASLVAASHSIERVPSNVVPPIANVAADNAASWGYWKIAHGCTTATECVYGDTASTHTVALFGDSHAAMWLPALDWVGRRLGFRVVLLWSAGCPAADVNVWNSSSRSINAACNTFRAQSLVVIAKLAPELVLTANRTADVLGVAGKYVPSATWQAGLETTLKTLLADKLKVAVIGDVSPLSSQIPGCLAAFPRGVQRCSSPNPNPAMHTELKAEVAAAKDEGVPYLDPQPWLCTKVCSPIVGKYVVY